ncbi:porin, partial [Mycolicibacterium smegmatis]|nr:porin [Mycolicibacterium smegmatis]
MRYLVMMFALLVSVTLVSPRPANAVDNQLSVVDGQGRTLTVQQAETFLN